VVLASGEEVTVDGLPVALRPKGEREAPRSFDVPFSRAKQEAIEAFEKAYVTDALTRTGGSVAEAARLCGLDKSNFRRIVRRYKLDAGSFRKGTGGPGGHR
jgi:two-component system response regulator HydG